MKNKTPFWTFFILVFLNALMCGMGIFASLEMGVWHSDPVKFVKNPPATSSFPIFPLMTLLIILLMILTFIFVRKLKGHVKRGIMITVVGTFVLNILAIAYFIPVEVQLWKDKLITDDRIIYLFNQIYWVNWGRQLLLLGVAIYGLKVLSDYKFQLLHPQRLN